MTHPNSESELKGSNVGREDKKKHQESILTRSSILREGIEFEQDLMKKIKTLYGFFSNLDDEELLKILQVSKRHLLKEGDMILHEGSSPDQLFIIIFGSVQITIKVRERDEELAVLGPGNCFGEMGLLNDGPRSATAVANEDSLVFSITEGILRNADPLLCIKLFKNLAVELSSKLRKADDKIKELITQKGDK